MYSSVCNSNKNAVEQKSNTNTSNNLSFYENTPLLDGTVQWIVEIFELNLQRMVFQSATNPMIKAYSDRSFLEWCKIIGVLSSNNISKERILALFKKYLNIDFMTDAAVYYFTAMRFIRINSENQFKWLLLCGTCLTRTHKKTNSKVLCAMLLTFVNVFRQLQMYDCADTNEVLLICDINDLLRKIGDNNGATVKKLSYLSNCLLFAYIWNIFRVFLLFL